MLWELFTKSLDYLRHAGNRKPPARQPIRLAGSLSIWSSYRVPEKPMGKQDFTRQSPTE
jgi:hypothetical protein